MKNHVNLGEGAVLPRTACHLKRCGYDEDSVREICRLSLQEVFRRELLEAWRRTLAAEAAPEASAEPAAESAAVERVPKNDLSHPGGAGG